MKWQDQGIVLGARRHGENSWITSLFTFEHGRHLGLLRLSKKDLSFLQVGNFVQASWSARLVEQLGMWQLELTFSPLARLIHDPLKLIALTSVTQLLNSALPERHVYPALYQSLEALIHELTLESQDLHDQTRWLKPYALFELMMLEQLGYGLDLTRCAATGQRDDLIFVSPKSGRAVSREAGLPYQERLFKFPAFLKGRGEDLLEDAEVPPSEIGESLKMTGHFITINFFNRGLPESRSRLYEWVSAMGNGPS
jgi:DNA repair protein RecO (recombination protein O)